MPKRRKLTTTEKQKVIAALATGCSRENAAYFAKCTPYLIRRELSENKSFAAEVAKAEGDSEIFFITKIRNAANKEQYWRAAAWALERRLPNRYAPRGAGTLSMDQVKTMISRLTDIVIQEIPGGKERQKILKRIHDLICEENPKGESADHSNDDNFYDEYSE